MKYVFAFVLLSLPFVSIAQNTPSEASFDGAFWSGMSEAQRSSYVFGYVSGYDRGYADARREESLRLKESAWWPSSTMGNITAQVNKFYADYKNTPVCMEDAIYEAVNSLEGKASTETDLVMLRSRASIKKCK